MARSENPETKLVLTSEALPGRGLRGQRPKRVRGGASGHARILATAEPIGASRLAGACNR